MLILIALALRTYQTSAWIRYDDEQYKQHYNKSTNIFGRFRLNEDLNQFKKKEKFQFYFNLFLILLLIYFKIIL